MASRNQKATLMAGAMFVIAGAIAVCAALVKPETRIVGTINGRRVDIPVWLQNEPEYAKIKNAKVENGWGWARLVLGAIALVPTGVGVALVAERRAELPEEAEKYAQDQKEKKQLAQVKTNYKVNLAATMLKKTGEAKVVIHEEELEMKVDAYREVNGIYAPEPIRQIEPPLLREKEATGNPFEGMKTPEEYAQELKAAREGAIARLPTDGTGDGSVAEGRTADGIPTDPNFLKWEQRGGEVMDSLAEIKISILSAGPTGSGKTHTMDKWLRDIRTLYPKAEIWAIGQKLDPFCGLLNEGRVQVFQDFSMEASMQYLDKVYNILQLRRKTPKHQRAALYDDHPVRLILDDWFSIYQALLNDSALWRVVKQKISSIITVGREFNVCLYVCTQSYNLEALGIADDGNIRANLAIICQGFVKLTTDAKGKVTKQGDYTVLLQLLKNQSIIPDKEDRDRLLTELRMMMVLSREYQRPIIFSAIDEPTLVFPPHITIENLEEEEVETQSTNVAVADRNDVKQGLDLWEEFEVELARRKQQIDLNSDCINANAPDVQDELDDDSTSVSDDDTCINAGINAETNAQGELPNYDEEELEYLKHLPASNELLKMLENSPEGYSLPNFVRNRLKVTTASNARRAKRAIVGLVKKLNRDDLWDKFELHKFNNL